MAEALLVKCQELKLRYADKSDAGRNENMMIQKEDKRSKVFASRHNFYESLSSIALNQAPSVNY